MPEARLTFAAGAVAAGIALSPVSNYAITGNFALTPGGSSFLFGRLVEDGIVIRYLNEKCPDPALRLCAFTEKFPTDADWWLWDGSSPFRKIGDFAGSAEEKAIALETLKLYPAMHLTAALRATLAQLVKFATEVASANTEPTVAMFKEHTPALFPQFMQARQQAQPFDVAPLNAVHIPVAASGDSLPRRRFGVWRQGSACRLHSPAYARHLPSCWRSPPNAADLRRVLGTPWTATAGRPGSGWPFWLNTAMTVAAWLFMPEAEHAAGPGDELAPMLISRVHSILRHCVNLGVAMG